MPVLKDGHLISVFTNAFDHAYACDALAFACYRAAVCVCHLRRDELSRVLHFIDIHLLPGLVGLVEVASDPEVRISAILFYKKHYLIVVSPFRIDICILQNSRV